MKKVDNRTLSWEERFHKQRAFNTRLEIELKKSKNDFAKQSFEVMDLEYKIESLEQLLEDKDKKISELREWLSSDNLTSNCQCTDWDSCGTDPDTWDKLKKCNDCGLISVR